MAKSDIYLAWHQIYGNQDCQSIRKGNYAKMEEIEVIYLSERTPEMEKMSMDFIPK